MADSNDFMKMMQDAAQAFRLNPEKLQEALRSQAGFGEKLSKVALEAAGKSADLSASYARETLAKMGDITKARETPTDYAAAMQAFAQAQSDMMQAQVRAFAEIAKSVQEETLALMATAAKTAQEQSEDAAKAVGDIIGQATKPRK